MVKHAPKLPLETPAPLPPEDVKWSSVSLAEVLERGARFEASVYDIEGKHAREILSKCKWGLTTITGAGGLATCYHRPRFRRIFVEKSDYPIYQPSQITEIYPKPYLWISPKTDTDIDSLRVKQNQILVTCSGTIGKCTIVSETLRDCIFSHDLLRVTTNNVSEAGYLYAFLRAHIGQTLLRTNNYGAVISHIEPEHLNAIPIPNPPPIIKSTVHKLVMDSFRLRDESNQLIDQAEHLLITELQLPSIEKLKTKQYDESTECQNYSVKLSEIAGRFEPTYHKPIVDAIINHIKKHAKDVVEISDRMISKAIILPGRFKRVYVEEGQGVVFFGGKELLQLDPSGNKFLSLKHHSKRITEELTLKENMIMVTCSGTIGKTALVPKHWEGWTANQHILRIVPADEAVAGYIYAWLSSDYGYELVTRFTYGAVVNEIDDNQIAKVQIPLLKDQVIQKKINTLVLEANQKRYEAYLLEQEAIQTVNKQVIFAEK